MLTIARNLALGHGPSVEAGTTLTNGTQPLMTGVYAGVFWLVGGDKLWGVVLVQVLGILIALSSAFVLYRIGSILFAELSQGLAVAAIAAAAWYVSPIGTRYTQNCLETGAAALLPMVIGLYVLRHRLAWDRPWPIRRCLELGVLLALAFWVRNDAVLLSVSVCITLFLSALGANTEGLGRRFLEAGCIGLTALLMVSPWLIFNYVGFGHVVPVSGISQGADMLGENLLHLPAILVELVSIVGLIPGPLETRPVVLISSLLLLLAWVVFVYRATRELEPTTKPWLAMLSLWAGLLVGFYGLAYGAGYFVGRYLFPLSPWAALMSVWLARRLWIRAGGASPRLAAGVTLAFVLLISVGLDLRVRRHGMNNGHFQVVEWVGENVSDDVWVAAIQTGTLGFFHDRSYNLDGKVSPPALQARFEGRIFEYILERPIMYLVDWVGIAGWLDDPRLGDHFDLLLLDEARDLAVLRRRDPPKAATP